MTLDAEDATAIVFLLAKLRKAKEKKKAKEALDSSVTARPI